MQVLGTGTRKAGFDLGRDIVKALGFEGKTVEKLVLVIQAKHVPVVYVKGFIHKDQLDKAAEVLKGGQALEVAEVNVSDQCEVSYVPKGTPE